MGRTATISPVADTVTYIICMSLRSSSAANWFAVAAGERKRGVGRRGRAEQEGQPRATYSGLCPCREIACFDIN